MAIDQAAQKLEKLKKLDTVLNLLSGEGLSKQDFHDYFQKVIEIVQKIEKRTSDAIDGLEKSHNLSKSTIEKSVTAQFKEISTNLETRLSDTTTTTEQLQSSLEALDSKIAALPVTDEKKLATDILAQVPPHFEAADEIRNKLEVLQGDERLDKSAIKGLDTLEAQLTEVKNRPAAQPAKAYMVQKKDVSAQCNGSQKTFSVGGSHFGVLGVYSTEFPIIYRPIIDYTETNTGIVLTSAVAAPASGQTLVIQFLK